LLPQHGLHLLLEDQLLLMASRLIASPLIVLGRLLSGDLLTPPLFILLGLSPTLLFSEYRLLVCVPLLLSEPLLLCGSLLGQLPGTRSRPALVSFASLCPQAIPLGLLSGRDFLIDFSGLLTKLVEGVVVGSSIQQTLRLVAKTLVFSLGRLSLE